MSGDEFAVVLPDANRASAAELAKYLMEAVARPLELDSISIDVTVSIGIALAPDDAIQSDALQRRADVAMYAAKARRGDYAFYSPEQDHDSREQIELAADLRRAIERNELFLQYQPIVAIESGEVVEVEALIRWTHPTRGLVSPAQFIPLAEETGAILPIGQWVMREACEEAARWQQTLPSSAAPRVSINVSARQFQHSDVVGDVSAILAQTHLDPDRLKVEITETVAMADPEMTIASLWSLKGLGVHIAIDDFGTGYSSLGYLKRFPADTLKIDKLFIDGLGVHPEDSAIVAATIAFARAVGLSTTAEGVESAEQVADLRALGVDRVQGYFYSRPLSSGDMLALLERNAMQQRSEGLSVA